jgi:CTD small phosphatase-like protein 2
MENLIKIRSESETLKSSRHIDVLSNRSLPRGDYMQNVIGPKLNKSPMQPQPISHRPVDGDDSAENSPVQDHREIISTAPSDSQSSEDDSPSTIQKGRSLFSKQSKFISQTPNITGRSIFPMDGSLQHQKLPEKSQTPVIGRKKMDLYKLSIMQNVSKFSETQNQQKEIQTQTHTEEVKHNEINKVRNTLVETLKNQGDIHRSQNTSIIHSDSASDLSSAFSKLDEKEFSFRKLVFGPNIDERTLQKHMMLVLRGLNYSIKLLKGPPISYIESRQIVLKELKKKNTKTLLLDLDETLITSCSKRDGPEKVLIPDGDKNHPIMIKIRPYVKEFLKKMKEHFEILVFTASCSVYAETVVKEIDPDKKYISYILDRNFCLETKNGFFIKDLRIIKNRELKNMIIVDNLVHSFGFQIENGVPILEWTGNKNDQELKHLADYLIDAKKYDDVRDYNREKLNLVDFARGRVEETEDF